MATLRKGEVLTSIATQGTAQRTPATTGFTDVALPEDGMQLRGSKSIEDFITEHRFQGVKYRSVNQRNAEEVSLQIPLFPNVANTIFRHVFDRTSGALDYLTIRHWLYATLAASTEMTPRVLNLLQFEGVVLNGISFTIDRSSGQSGPIVADLTCFVNAKEAKVLSAIDGDRDTCSALAPVGGTDFVIDWVPDKDNAYSGDNSDLKRLGFQFGNGIELDGFSSSATAKYDKGWTQQDPAPPTLSLEVTALLSQSDYLLLDEGSGIDQGKFRIAWAHPSGTSTTTASTITLGDNDTQTLAFADATGFAAGDVVLMRQPIANNFVFLPIDAISTNDVDFDTDTAGSGNDAFVTMNGGSEAITVQNMAGGIIVPQATLTNVSPLAIDGNKKVVNLTYQADIEAVANAALLTHHTYDHLSSHA